MCVEKLQYQWKHRTLSWGGGQKISKINLEEKMGIGKKFQENYVKGGKRVKKDLALKF